MKTKANQLYPSYSRTAIRSLKGLNKPTESSSIFALLMFGRCVAQSLEFSLGAAGTEQTTLERCSGCWVSRS